jgi:hypothetical protein
MCVILLWLASAMLSFIRVDGPLVRPRLGGHRLVATFP